MSDHQHDIYEVTVTLAAGHATTTLLRLVSILHSRGTAVHNLTFDGGTAPTAVVTARVTLGTTGPATLQESLRRMVELLEVDVVPEPRQAPLERPTPIRIARGRRTVVLR